MTKADAVRKLVDNAITQVGNDVLEKEDVRAYGAINEALDAVHAALNTVPVLP